MMLDLLRPSFEGVVRLCDVSRRNCLPLGNSLSCQGVCPWATVILYGPSEVLTFAIFRTRNGGQVPSMTIGLWPRMSNLGHKIHASRRGRDLSTSETRRTNTMRWSHLTQFELFPDPSITTATCVPSLSSRQLAAVISSCSRTSHIVRERIE